MAQKFAFITQYRETDPLAVWSAFKCSILDNNVPDSTVRLSGKKSRWSKVEDILRATGEQSFRCEGSELDVSLGYQGYWRCGMIYLMTSNNVDINLLANFASRLLRLPSTIYGWLIDHDYDYWQNIDEPSLYAAANRYLPPEKIISNGAKPPTNRMVVDRSTHPGRFVFRQGYIEAIGGMMWFSERFWPLTGASKEEAVARGMISPLPEDPSLCEAILDENLFANAEGDDALAELQDRYRDLLFPSHRQQPIPL